MLRPWDGEHVESGGKALRKELSTTIKSGTWNLWAFELKSILKDVDGTPSCFLYGYIYISRQMLMPLTEIVIPLYMTVALTIGALVFRLEELTVRVDLAVCGLFSTLVYLYVVKLMLPPISFFTWTHYYMVVCMIFVAVVVAEITLCHYLDPTGEGGKEQVEEHAMRMDNNFTLDSGKASSYTLAEGKGGGGVREPLLKASHGGRPPRKSATASRAAFEKIDVDSSGNLSKQETRNVFSSMGVTLSDDELDKLFSSTKAQFNGTLGNLPGGSKNPHCLSIDEFQWARKNLKSKKLRAALNKAVDAERQFLGLTAHKVPIIDRWCGRLIPILFSAVVLIMLMAQVPNMMYKGPPLVSTR